MIRLLCIDMWLLCRVLVFIVLSRGCLSWVVVRLIRLISRLFSGSISSVVYVSEGREFRCMLLFSLYSVFCS